MVPFNQHTLQIVIVKQLVGGSVHIGVWVSGLAPIPPQSEVAPISRSKNRPSLSGLYHIAFGLKISDGV